LAMTKSESQSTTGGAYPPYSIRTYTGKLVCPFIMAEDDIDIRDIAHALSQLCRYSGHTSVLYSVAEHSVRVAWYIERRTQNKKMELAGLLHDAEEAYLLDFPSPLKKHPNMAWYRRMGKVLRKQILAHWGVSDGMDASYVKHADRVLLATEQRDLMRDAEPDGDEYLAGSIRPWEATVAERRFLLLFERLRNELGV